MIFYYFFLNPPSCVTIESFKKKYNNFLTTIDVKFLIKKEKKNKTIDVINCTWNLIIFTHIFL